MNEIKWSYDGETFNYDSVEELLDNECYAELGDTVYYGEVAEITMEDLVSGHTIMESVQEAAYDLGGEFAEYYPEMTREQIADLKKVVVGWFRENVSEPNFFKVRNVKQYEITEDDL